MSPDLIAFLKAWYDWATNGAPEGEPFNRRSGLCHSRFDFFRDDPDKRIAARAELRRLFDYDQYPFGEADYDTRYFNGTQHECPKRLAWVRERLIEAGEPVT